MANAQHGSLLMESATARGTLTDAGHGVRYTYNELSSGKLSLTVWQGRSMRPCYHYLVRDREHGAKAISEIVRNSIAADLRKAERAAERAIETAKNRLKYKVGTLLCNSWGYDQTNIDYYEVTKCSKTGASVEVRSIGAKQVGDSAPHGSMSCTLGPCPGSFQGEPIKKRVTSYGVQFEHGWTSIIDEDSTHNKTWYA